MKYILTVLVLAIAISAKAQNDLQRSPKGALYQIFPVSAGIDVPVPELI